MTAAIPEGIAIRIIMIHPANLRKSDMHIPFANLTFRSPPKAAQMNRQ
jgi:hypothetical protein